MENTTEIFDIEDADIDCDPSSDESKLITFLEERGLSSSYPYLKTGSGETWPTRKEKVRLWTNLREMELRCPSQAGRVRLDPEPGSCLDE
ncbi:hypothetical protein ACLKA6_018415, partial [Drosophila palustris]